MSWDRFVRSVSSAGETISRAVSSAGETVSRAVGGVAETASRAVGGVTESVSRAVSSVTETVSRSVSGATETVSRAVGGVAETASRAISSATETVSRAVSGVTETVSRSVGGISDTGSGTSGSTRISSGSSSSAVSEYRSSYTSSRSSSFSVESKDDTLRDEPRRDDLYIPSRGSTSSSSSSSSSSELRDEPRPIELGQIDLGKLSHLTVPVPTSKTEFLGRETIPFPKAPDYPDWFTRITDSATRPQSRLIGAHGEEAIFYSEEHGFYRVKDPILAKIGSAIEEIREKYDIRPTEDIPFSKISFSDTVLLASLGFIGGAYGTVKGFVEVGKKFVGAVQKPETFPEFAGEVVVGTVEWGASIPRRVASGDPYEMGSVFGELATLKAIPQVPKVPGRLAERLETAGKEFVPIEKLTQPEVLAREATFPFVRETKIEGGRLVHGERVPPSEAVPATIRQFEVPSRAPERVAHFEELAKGEGVIGYHATPKPWMSGKAEIEIISQPQRAMDVSGLYIAPDVSPYFLRVSRAGEGSLSELPRAFKEAVKEFVESPTQFLKEETARFFGFDRPSIITVKTKGVEAVPKPFSESVGGYKRFFSEGIEKGFAEPGKAYIEPKTGLLHITGEVQAVIPQRNVLRMIREGDFAKYTEFEGRRVRIYEAEVVEPKVARAEAKEVAVEAKAERAFLEKTAYSDYWYRKHGVSDITFGYLSRSLIASELGRLRRFSSIEDYAFSKLSRDYTPMRGYEIGSSGYRGRTGLEDYIPPPRYKDPVPPGYDPIPPTYEDPIPPKYEDPIPPKYEDPIPPKYEDPIPPKYEDPIPPGYGDIPPPKFEDPIPKPRFLPKFFEDDWKKSYEPPKIKAKRGRIRNVIGDIMSLLF